MRKTTSYAVILLSTLFVSVSTSIKAYSLISSADILENTINSGHILDNSIKASDILDGSLTGADIKDGSISTYDIMDGTLSTYDLKDNSLQSIDIKDSSILSIDIQDNTVTGLDVKNGTIGLEDLQVSVVNTINGLNVNLNGVQLTLQQHQQGISDANTASQLLNSQISLLNSDVADLKSRVTSLENNFANISNTEKHVWVKDNLNNKLGILLGEHTESSTLKVQYFDISTNEVINDFKNGPTFSTITGELGFDQLNCQGNTAYVWYKSSGLPFLISSFYTKSADGRIWFHDPTNNTPGVADENYKSTLKTDGSCINDLPTGVLQALAEGRIVQDIGLTPITKAYPLHYTFE